MVLGACTFGALIIIIVVVVIIVIIVKKNYISCDIEVNLIKLMKLYKKMINTTTGISVEMKK